MIQVIINADDLGLNRRVNKAIGDALRFKKITSSTILANNDTWDEVHQIVNANPTASFGIHLNLTEGPALTESEVLRKEGIVDENNYFTKKIFDIKSLNDILFNAIYNEWDAQIKKVRNIEKINITHIDGHHHIHTQYVLRNVLLCLSQKYKIRIIRNMYHYPNKGGGVIIEYFTKKTANSWNYYVLKKMVSLFKNKYLSIVCNYLESHLWRSFFSRKIFFTTYFDSYEHFIKQMNRGCELPNNSIVELMCHPGHDKFCDEYELVCNSMLEKLLPKSILISYKTIYARIK